MVNNFINPEIFLSIFFSIFVEKKYFRFEKIGGFYKGLKPNLTRVVPATCVTFVTYEKMSHYLLNMNKSKPKVD